MGIALFNLMNRLNRFMDPDLDVPPCPPELLALLS